MIIKKMLGCNQGNAVKLKKNLTQPKSWPQHDILASLVEQIHTHVRRRLIKIPFMFLFMYVSFLLLQPQLKLPGPFSMACNFLQN